MSDDLRDRSIEQCRRAYEALLALRRDYHDYRQTFRGREQTEDRRVMHALFEKLLDLHAVQLGYDPIYNRKLNEQANP